MIEKKIPYQRLRHFSYLIKEYLDQSDKVKGLYHRFPSIENFEGQIVDKASNFPNKNRILLHDVVKMQYEELSDTKATSSNINLLKNETSFTITTGHQLNLFTGPLYFLYKIISTINLCKQLKETYPQYNFIPIYWMATEDHDFEEIKFFNLEDRKVVYERESSGAVGRLDTAGMEEINAQLGLLLGASKYSDELTQLFKNSYSHKDLASATRALAHQLFKEDGLVIIDADDRDLKTVAIPYFERELMNMASYNAVQETLEHWNPDFKVQVQPREINLFYLNDDGRYRIIKRDNTFYLDGIDKKFDEQDLLDELQSYPERFSPNVIMRPLYQELILPNLCYIGGGGEIAYWLELKSYFESQDVLFPILLLRNSVVIINEKQSSKLKSLDLEIEDLFLEDYKLKEKMVNDLAKIDVDFDQQKAFLEKQFVDLYEIAQKTDPSFIGAVAAQEKKQIKGLRNLEKRLLKAQKRKWKDHLDRAILLKLELFPKDSLQERQVNFSQFYKDHGPFLIDQIKKSLDPLDDRFTVIKI